jgi:hypothetical protein
MKYDTRLLEISLAFMSLVWGAWLLLPFDVFTSSSSFTNMGVLPEWVWGITMTSLALCNLYTLWGNTSEYIRARLLQLSSSIWIFISAGMFLSNWKSTGPIVYLSLALISGVTSLILFRRDQHDRLGR